MITPVKILIVDDSESEALLMIDMLRQGGFEPEWQRVASVQDFSTALQQPWDVILHEYTTPDCSTAAALNLVKQHTVDTPLIVVSRSAESEATKTAIFALRAGAADYLFKSQLVELGQSINRALEQRQERREMVRVLRLHERAIESSNQGFIIADARAPDIPIIFVNSGFEQITGYPRAEVIGRNCRFLQGPKTDPAVSAEISLKLRQGEPCAVEILNYRKDGTSFWNALTISPIRDAQGTLTHFVGIQSDITDKRELEGQLLQAQKMEAIGRLAGGVAHDFNNLLTIILGCSGFVLDSNPDPETTQLLQQIRHAGERAAALTRQLLLFSRKHVAAPEFFDLNEAVKGIQMMLQRIIGPNVTLHTELDPEQPWIKTDRSQFEQVLLNLVINARDAMPQGGEVTIRTRNFGGDTQQVQLSITDTGTGMSEEVQKRLFEPFFTTKEPGKGTGLGLPIVFGIIRQSGGTIKVHSAPGTGTTFEIRLPLANREICRQKSPERVAPVPAGHETILLAEDDQQVRQLARLILKKAGYHVLEAAHGRDGLELARKYDGPIHLLITDVVMPEVNGCQLAIQLRAVRPQLRVIFISGFNEEAIVRHGVTTGEIPFLHKPFSNSGLIQKVREVLDEPEAKAAWRMKTLSNPPENDTGEDI